jgi:hypothetical protein
MKKCIYCFLFIFSACLSPKVIPLKGNYPSTPITFHSEKTVNAIWDNIIDFFAQKGLSIKIIDKSSGLIISDNSKLSYSFENKYGKIKDTTAWVILNTIIDRYKNPYKPNSVSGSWNIRIKNDGTGTLINVNLVNIKAVYGSYYYSEYSHTIVEPVDVKGNTTGKFEQLIYDYIK